MAERRSQMFPLTVGLPAAEDGQAYTMRRSNHLSAKCAPFIERLICRELGGNEGLKGTELAQWEKWLTTLAKKKGLPP